MGKYEPLYRHLRQPNLPSPLTLSLSQLATILGLGRLPDSAHTRNEWWANNENRHVQTVWLQAGWKATPHRTTSTGLITSVTFAR
jgi:hypothetical protein